MRADRLPHRCAYILVFNSRGELYVQKRTVIKDIYPGYWDPAAGGVMQVGESYEESAAREVGEELGVRGVELRPLFDMWFEDERSAVWGRAFTCVYDGPLELQVETGGADLVADRFTGVSDPAIIVGILQRQLAAPHRRRNMKAAGISGRGHIHKHALSC